MSTILDLHCHSDASEDSRAPVEAYLNWIRLRRSERPLDGIVLTEHRQFNRVGDYRPLEDKYGLAVLRASALQGWGVVETFRELVGRTYDHIDARFALAASHGLTKNDFIDRLTRQTTPNEGMTP